MSFVMPQGVRQFFSFDSARPFARSAPKRESAPRFLMFDAYYACLVLGLDGARLGEEARLEATNFLSAYPENYKGEAELIAGLLVDAELRRQSIRSDDRKDIEAQMVALLDLSSATRLSQEGDRLLNLYAVAGFEKLRTAIMPPDNLEDFLVAYHGLWASDQAAA